MYIIKAHSLDWLPATTRVRIIVSTYTSSTTHNALAYRNPKPPQLSLTPLPEKYACLLVSNTLAHYRKKLDDSPGNNQMRFLLRKNDAFKPLFLVVACEELRLFGLYEKLTQKIKTMASTIPKLFEEVLQRIEADQDKEMLKATLCLISCARTGLKESELLRVLAREKRKETHLPRAAWSPLLAALLPFLRPIAESGDGTLSFFHGHMEQAVRKRYLIVRNNELKTHKQLAQYFLVQAKGRDGQWTDERRAISELPYHLLKARMWEELETVLCDLAFVQTKCRLGMAFDLLLDYSDALHAEHQWEGKQRLQDFSSFFSQNVHILAQQPELTLQQAANQPDNSAPALDASSRIAALGNLTWVKWLNKPQSHGACMLTVSPNAEPVMACAYSPDGSQIVIASRDQTLRICNAATGQELVSLVGHTNWVVGCAFSPDGSRVVSASWDCTLRIWDVHSGAEVACLRGHSRRVNAVAYSNDGRRIASASWDCSIRIWDANSANELRKLSGHTKPVNAVAFSPDDTMLVSGSWDCTIKIWDVEEGNEIRTLSGHTKSVRSVQFSPTGNQVVSTSVDTTVKVWDARTGQLSATLSGHSKPVNTCAFSTDGKHLVSASDDLTVKVWDALGGREIGKLAASGSLSVISSDLSPDQKRIVAALSDCSIGIWDVFGGELIVTMQECHTRTVNACCFSPDGKMVISCSDDGTIRMYNPQDGSLVRVLTGHTDCVNDCCYSSDGRTILSASDDFTLKLWDARTGQVQQTLHGHTNRVTGCAFSPDGKRVASSSRDCTLRLWDPQTGSIKKIFRGTYSFSANNDEHKSQLGFFFCRTFGLAE